MAKEKNKTELPKVMEGELQARLIKLREDAGFDIPQMADALCLSEDVITNLENEAFDLLPEPPYVRGYLRNYAKLSNDNDVDAAELINRYESLRGADASELDFQAKTNKNIAAVSKKRISPIWGQLILLGILVGAIALISSIPAVNTWITNTWQSFSSQLEPTDASNNPSLLGNLPVPAPLPVEEVAIDQQTTTSTESIIDNQSAAPTTTEAPQTTEGPKTTENTATETTPETSSTDTVEKTQKETTEAATTDTTKTETQTIAETTDSTETETQEIASTSADGSINIKLVFNKEVWLRIKDKENKTVFEGLNQADTEKTIDLKKPLTFRVGNAQGLSLFIDNKAVNITSYINGSIANFTLE